MTLDVVKELLEGFAALMDSGALMWVLPLAGLGLWLVYVLLVTVHELGHAVVGLTYTSDRVFLRVGRAPGLIHGRLGRLEVSWHVRGREKEDDGRLSLETPILEHREGLLFALAGPIANVLLALLLIPTWAALSGIPQICVAAVIGMSLFIAAHNLTSKSQGSDGRVALSALRSLNARRRARTR